MKTQKKNVLVIASWFDPNNTIGNFFLTQAEILSRTFNVTMCFPSDIINTYDIYGLKLFSYKKINTKLNSSNLNALKAKIQLHKTVKAIMRNGQFDVCIAQNIITAGFVAYELKKLYKIPYVTIHHNAYHPGVEYFNTNWRVGRVLKSSLENFVVSNDLCRQFRIAGRTERIKVIHNPVTVDFEIKSNDFRNKNQIIIAISGQFNSIVKNHDLFFHSLGFIRDETLHKLKVVWLGYNSWGGNYLEEDVLLGIKKALVNLDIDIEIYSSLQKQEMLNYLANSDLYVQTGFTETFGITALEAIKLGVPVLSTQNGGINEYIIPNVNGIVINSFEPSIFGKGLQNILDNLNKFDPQLVKGSVENVATEEEYLRVLTETIGDSSN
jgi:glycosyltransferase involved in cell wall biosynthesis